MAPNVLDYPPFPQENGALYEKSITDQVCSLKITEYCEEYGYLWTPCVLVNEPITSLINNPYLIDHAIMGTNARVEEGVG